MSSPTQAGRVFFAVVTCAVAWSMLSGCPGSSIGTSSIPLPYPPEDAKGLFGQDVGSPSPTCLADLDCAPLAKGPCVRALCEPTSKRCVVGPAPEFGACDDGDPCSSESVCLGGACSALKVTNCDDGNPCTQDSCDAAQKGPPSGEPGCVHTPISGNCGDGNPCTVGDHCDGGACVADSNACACKTNADCKSFDSADPCDGSLVCSAGKCVVDPNTVITCTAQSVCETSSCNPKTGTCETAKRPDGTVCDDSNVCTFGETCQQGACKPASVLPCGVNGGECATAACDGKLGCVAATATQEQSCDDGNACTAGDHCVSGVCVGSQFACPCGQDTDCAGAVASCLGKPVCVAGTCQIDPAFAQPCAQPKTPCTVAVCTNAGCMAVPEPAGAPCGGGVTTCTTGDVCDAKGVCKAGKPLDCNDGNPCTTDACLNGKGCVHGPVKDGATCDDGSACSLSDACQAGVCVGTKAACDDDDPCTDDLCDPVKPSACKHIEKPSGGACDDGDACTSGEVCVSKICSPKGIVLCDDGSACTLDKCDGTGGCSHFPANDGGSCDDGNPCTTSDSCKAGACLGDAGGCQCTVDEDCAKFEDGNACNGTLRCEAGACVIDGGTIVTCEASTDPCLISDCDAGSGLCVLKAGVPGTPCDDQSACTAGEICGAGGGCGGGVIMACDDGDLCTQDQCDPVKGCTHSPWDGALGVPCDDGNVCTQGEVCGAGGCTGGVNSCQCTIDAECAAYEDGNLCNGTLVCLGGDCTNAGNPITCDTGGDTSCIATTCDPVTGACAKTPLPDGTACDAAQGCATGGSCQGGVCVGATTQSCDDANPCTVDTCESTGCKHAPLVGGPCDDGNPCTQGESCTTGQCAGGSNVCTCAFDADCAKVDDGNLCNGIYICVGGLCQPKPNSVVLCDASKDGPCQKNVCDPGTGVCAIAKQADGSLCDDGDACTTGEHCTAGACAGGAFSSCADTNPCTDDGCNPVYGCWHQNSTKLCDDGNTCTVGDSCQGGQCVSGPNQCACATKQDCAKFEDGDLCNGTLVCVAGQCKLDPATIVTCDPSQDGPCHKAICEPKTGVCQTTPFPDGVACDDGNGCSFQDQCKAGTCMGTLVQCEDNNLCTDDICDAQKGCTHVANNAPCDDGNPCTKPDACAAGVCTAGPSACTCVTTADCKAFEDGSVCNGTLYCQAGSCVVDPKTVIDCGGSSNQCAIVACDPLSGACNVASKADGTPCDDGSVCTPTSACFGGACVGSSIVDCDDKNPCTTDACDNANGCKHTPSLLACDDGNPCTSPDACNLAGQCMGGVNTCLCTKNADCVPYEDNNLCNGTLVCQGNVCVVDPSTVIACDTTQDTPCVKTSCNPLKGACEKVAQADGTACNDSSVCTVGESCMSGACVGLSLDCSDQTTCTIDNCDPTKGCLHAPLSGQPCDDGNPCTKDDACVAGSCQAGANTCSCQTAADCLPFEDGNLCNGTLVCTNNQCAIDPATVVTCPQGIDSCRPLSCDPGAGVCVQKPAADGTPCGGAVLCGGVGTCAAGNCVGAIGCPDDGNPCTTALCDALKGCSNVPANGACEDGDVCTSGDMCVGGACQPGPNQCNCKVDTDCAKFDDGDKCNGVFTCQAGSCKLDPATVVTCPPATNACSLSACDPTAGACVNKPAPNGTLCPDSDACTQSEQCFSGVCIKQAVSCADLEFCTIDSCDPKIGCVHKNNQALCNDGNPCTQLDVCQGGKCTGIINTCQCKTNQDCASKDDGNLCNGSLSCQGGTCKIDPKTIITCDASKDKACLKNTCLPKTGSCVMQPAPAGTACNDSNACTAGDVCAAGTCIGIPMTCDDGIACTVEKCDPTAGCLSVPNDALCPDGDPCTDDVCNQVAGCTHPGKLTGACDDGNACTAGETCGLGAAGPTCQGGAPTDCNDADPCTLDACDPKAGCVHTQAKNGTACNDGDPCTAGDTCQAGSCSGAASNCDDGNACTADSCAPSGACTHVPQPGACSDNNACTTNDVCVGGVCGGSPTDCNDGNPCTTDLCNAGGPAPGCDHLPAMAACDDGDPCTSGDQCLGGKCAPGVPSCQCKVDPDCAPFDDGDKCNGTLVCDAGQCVVDPVTIPDCSGLVAPPCNKVSCAPQTGTCGITAIPDGSLCDDGTVCTGGDACSAGTCIGKPANCDDANVCTTDSCDPKVGCMHLSLSGTSCDDGNPCTKGEACSSGICTGGTNACVCKVTADCAPFEDGNLCNGMLVCMSNQCVIDPTSVVTCDTSVDGPCAKTICDPSFGKCVKNQSPDGTICDDANACTTGDVCAGGLCKGAAANCDDGNPCTLDACDPTSPSAGCVHSALSGNVCDDGNVCTTGDACQSGVCKGSPGACQCQKTADCAAFEDGDNCNGTLVCQATKCVVDPATVVTCDPAGNTACAKNLCAPTTGTCGLVPIADGSPCDDGNPCSTGDACSAGVCKGGALGCDDANPCTSDACLAGVGCVHTNVSAPCNDGNACTINDTCAAGTCTGAPKSCNDANPCTDDACVPSTGACANTPNAFPCDDGNPCTANDLCKGGQCVGGVATCDDGNACTDDLCEAKLGCVHTNNAAPCNDGNACTGGDSCKGGACAGSPVLCNDGNPCTDDACDPATGACITKNNAAPCDDGNACTPVSSCSGGVCVGQGNTCTCNSNADCAPYDNGDTCDGALTCQFGVCKVDPTTILACDDNDTCTTDACVKSTCTSVLQKCGGLSASGCVFGGCTGGTCTSVTLTPGAKIYTQNFDDGALHGFLVATTNPSVTWAVSKLQSASPGFSMRFGNPATNDYGIGQMTEASATLRPIALPASTSLRLRLKYYSLVDPQEYPDYDRFTLSANTTQLKYIAADHSTGWETLDYDIGAFASSTVQLEFRFVTVDGQLNNGQGVFIDDLEIYTPGKPGCCAVSSDCDDSNACTQDACDGTTSACVYLPSSGACDDGLPCTTGDACAGGKCTGVAKGCDDGNPCTDDSCDATGSCTHVANAAPCDDGNACTTGDVCSAGACAGKPGGPGCCAYDADCNDANACTVDLCSAGLCAHKPQAGAFFAQNFETGSLGGIALNSNNPNTKWQLDKQRSFSTPVALYAGNAATHTYDFGQAIATATLPSVTLPAGSKPQLTFRRFAALAQPSVNCGAGDGLRVTSGFTQLGAFCTNTAGVFVAESLDLSALAGQNVTLTFVFTANASQNAAEGIYVDDIRLVDAANTTATCCANGADCNDGAACTLDSCVGQAGGGICQHTAIPGCCKVDGDCSDGNACTTDTCNAATGTCAFANNTLPCDDGSACTSADTCTGGACKGSALSCNDGNACTDDGCDPKVGCTFTPNASSCDDGNPCTVGDVCSAGACMPGAPTGSCCKTNADCGDGNACTLDTCNTSNGACAHAPLDGPTCDDGNLCTTSDVCKSGICGGVATSCADGNVCTDDACDSTSGACVHAPNKASCDDGNACTGGDVCSGGSCKPGAAIPNCCTTNGQCDDGFACTTDTCASGKCVRTPLPCDDGLACTADICAAGTCSHAAIPSGSQVMLFQETFDDGKAGGFSITSDNAASTWQVDTKRASNGTSSLYFGNPTTHNYNTGKTTADALLPPLQLPSGGIQLRFAHWQQVGDPGCGKDDLTVLVNGAALAPQLCGNQGTFAQRIYSLDAFAGQVVQIDLRFDTVDALNNNTEGTYVDNVRVIATGSAGCCATDAQCVDTDACTADTCDAAASTCSHAPQNGALFAGTFDSGLGGLTVTSAPGSAYQWHTDTYRSFSPSSSIYAGNSATHTYDGGPGGATDTTATIPPIQLAAGSKPTLSFRFFQRIDPNEDKSACAYDRSVVSVNGVQVFMQCTDTVGTGFVLQTVDLSPYAGQSVSIAFQFVTGDSIANAGEGAYFDDIRVDAGPGVTCCSTAADCNDASSCTIDSCSGTGGLCSNAVAPTFNASFDDGTTGGLAFTSTNGFVSWMLDGLHKVSAPAALYVGNLDATGLHTYDVGAAKATATIPSLVVPTGVAKPALTFQVWYDRDPGDPGGCATDSFVTTVNGSGVDTRCVQQTGFVPLAIDLTPWSGQTISVQFQFVSNAFNNKGQGAWLDDIAISWSCN